MLIELLHFRDRVRVFPGRAEAGRILADLLEVYRPEPAGAPPEASPEASPAPPAIVLAIPAGGVPLAAEVARVLGLALDVAVVSKITLPDNTEVGFGAVAFDGSVLLNEELIARLHLRPRDIDEGLARTKEKVRRRVEALRGGRPFPSLAGRTAILIDDGLASGFTMSSAVRAVRKAGAAQVAVAIPTAHQAALDMLDPLVEELYCANVRSGTPFAVADAYRKWTDVGEDEARRILRGFNRGYAEEETV